MLQKPEKKGCTAGAAQRGLHSGGCTAGAEAANLPAAVCRLSRTYYQSSEPRLTILAAGFAFINKGSQNCTARSACRKRLPENIKPPEIPQPAPPQAALSRPASSVIVPARPRILPPAPESVRGCRVRAKCRGNKTGLQRYRGSIEPPAQAVGGRRAHFPPGVRQQAAAENGIRAHRLRPKLPARIADAHRLGQPSHQRARPLPARVARLRHFGFPAASFIRLPENLSLRKKQ